MLNRGGLRSVDAPIAIGLPCRTHFAGWSNLRCRHRAETYNLCVKGIHANVALLYHSGIDFPLWYISRKAARFQIKSPCMQRYNLHGTRTGCRGDVLDFKGGILDKCRTLKGLLKMDEGIPKKLNQDGVGRAFPRGFCLCNHDVPTLYHIKLVKYSSRAYCCWCE